MVKKILKSVEYRWARMSSKRFVNWLRQRGCKVGTGVEFHGLRDISIDTTRPSLVEIGNNVVFTRGCTILTHGYDWFVLKNLYDEVLASSGKVVIGNNVFLGLRTIILKGVTIGDNTIIGSGSVVTKNIPANSVAVGNPARVVCSIEDYFAKRKTEYVAEALAYARSIRETLNRDPVPADFWEEFPIFMQKEEVFEDIPVKRQLGKSYEHFRENHEPVYATFDEFIKSAGLK